MPPTTIRSSPSVADYIQLSEYQSQTPETFDGGKPVLHYHTAGAKAWIPKSQRGHLPFFTADVDSAPTGPEANAANGASEDQVEQLVDLFVSSETFTIFCPDAQSGVSIPYQSITLHALSNIGSGSGSEVYHSVYLQLELGDGGADDETFDTVGLTIIPPQTPQPPNEIDDNSGAAKPETSKLFEAISECSNLNPDPVGSDEDEDEEDRIVFEGEHSAVAVEGFSGVFTGSADGGLPPPMPGSSGWITAENVHEYFDEDGNWIGEDGVSGELGDGAGRVHARDEGDADGDDVNGAVDGGNDDHKRSRVE